MAKSILSITGSLLLLALLCASEGLAGSWPTGATPNAVAIRCVNTAGTAFEACGGGGGGGTIADGADVALGATTDAAATAGSTGTVSAKLRLLTSLLDALNTKLASTAAMADDESNPTLSKIATYPKVWDSASSNWDRMTKATADTDGIQTVRPHAQLTNRVSGVAGITDGSSTSVVAAQGASTRFCATTIVVSNSSATNVTVDIRDGTAGSVLMTIPAAANMGGGVIPLAVPLCTSANTIFAADPSAAASTVTISAVGFKSTL
ncbi:MAG: hypothetical protein HQL97_00425 [Magnetococcales bacterium]|nr:hypothetical protein [Magnetococcales bacterium]